MGNRTDRHGSEHCLAWNKVDSFKIVLVSALSLSLQLGNMTFSTCIATVKELKWQLLITASELVKKIYGSYIYSYIKLNCVIACVIQLNTYILACVKTAIALLES